MEETKKSFLGKLANAIKNNDRTALKDLETEHPDLMRRFREVAEGYVPGEPLSQRDNSKFLELIHSPEKPQKDQTPGEKNRT